MRLAPLGLALALAAGPLAAQDDANVSENRVAANTDWSVYEETDPRECWAVSAPKESKIMNPQGQLTQGRRGDILLMVFNRPGESVSQQVAFTGGYPFAGGSTVSLEIGGNSFELFTDGEWAWPPTPEEDARIVAELKRGASAVLTGRSGRGNTTVDDFSLLGFTAAVDDATARCQG
ncbi:hypothetical protein AADZ90_003690 [Aestuariibius sp. 2305UL40-4]|uniref:hypothetical protein n=1 Tax=Aestuariibius violaceus TaxID=3234132 RepID=UPI00345F05B4